MGGRSQPVTLGVPRPCVRSMSRAQLGSGRQEDVFAGLLLGSCQSKLSCPLVTDASCWFASMPRHTRYLVGIDGPVSAEGEVGEEKEPSKLYVATSLLGVDLHQFRTHLAIDAAVGGALEHRRVTAAAPGLRRARLGRRADWRDLPDRPAVVPRNVDVAVHIDRDLTD